MRNVLIGIQVMVALFLISTTAHAQKRVTASGKYQTEKRSVELFSNLEINGSLKVDYKQSKGKPGIEIYASDNVIPLIETQVRGNTLVVKFKPNTGLQNSGKIEINVSGPELEEIKVRGSGRVLLSGGMKTNKNVSMEVSGSGRISGEELKCNLLHSSVSGSGRIELEKVKTNHVESRVSGSGKTELAGTSQNATFKVSGSGSISASELKTANVTANVSGSGSIKVYATETLKGNTSGSGSVAYKGNPEVTFSQKGLRRL